MKYKSLKYHITMKQTAFFTIQLEIVTFFHVIRGWNWTYT